ncbi:MAG: hypothetical protein U0103_04185 [Candidatus Obscuribacterales bacterium]
MRQPDVQKGCRDRSALRALPAPELDENEGAMQQMLWSELIIECLKMAAKWNWQNA